MTNREWLNSLSDVELARVIHQGSDKDCTNFASMRKPVV